jgi:hypothetical protein
MMSDRAVDAAFAEFRRSGMPHVGMPDVAAVHRTVRRRHTRSRVGGVAAIAIVAAVTAFGASTLDGPVRPPANQSSSSAAPADPVAGSASTTPSGAATSPGLSTPSTTSQTPPDVADLALGLSPMTLSPPGPDGKRDGTLIVRIDNAGPAAAAGVRLTVRTPPGLRPAAGGAGGCALTGTPFRCTIARIASDDVAFVNLAFEVDPEYSGRSAADSRQVTIELTAGAARDPNPADNTSTYVIQSS